MFQQFNISRSGFGTYQKMMEMIMTRRGLQLLGKPMEDRGDMFKTGLGLI